MYKRQDELTFSVGVENVKRISALLTEADLVAETYDQEKTAQFVIGYLSPLPLADGRLIGFAIDIVTDELSA